MQLRPIRAAGQNKRQRLSQWRWVLATLLLLGLLNGARAPRALAAEPNEYEVKGAFLYNFLKFVDWPAGSFEHPNDPILVGIVGSDPSGGAMESMLRGKQFDGHPVVVHRFKPGDDLRTCRVIFVGAGEERHLRQILDSVKGAGVLTVGESEQFARLGGMITFTLDQQRVRFTINPEAAERSHLKISSKLLSLARIVHE
jgi:YfiR/HmsC-like